MTDSNSNPQCDLRPAKRRDYRGAALLLGIAGACAATCAPTGDLRLLLLIPPATALIAAAVSHYRRGFDQNVAALRQHIESVRDGSAPVESLSELQLHGELALLNAEVQRVLLDLKQEKRRQDELHAEMSQRVANRTDALERVIGSLRQQASRDALTGLFNRRVMDRYLREVFDRCQASSLDLALLMIDVDNFKPLNDTLGHPAGDELLKNIGRIIRSSIRDHDTAFRYGGDEFAIVLPGTDQSGAELLAKRLQELTAALSKTLRVATPPKLSVGLSLLSKLEDPSPESLIQKADAMLYAQKKSGKRPTSAGRSAA